MSENGQKKRETLADIVAEIRAYGAQPPPRLMWLEIADRIEAAWKRERESLMLGPRSWEECIERYKKAQEIHSDPY